MLTFISSQPYKLLFSMFLIFAYFFSALSISEVFEDYIEDIYIIVIHIVTVILHMIQSLYV